MTVSGHGCGVARRLWVSPFVKNCLEHRLSEKIKQYLQLLAVDHSARASMKNAASCEN